MAYSFLLLEAGGYLLKEDGGRLILEGSIDDKLNVAGAGAVVSGLSSVVDEVTDVTGAGVVVTTVSGDEST